MLSRVQYVENCVVPVYNIHYRSTPIHALPVVSITKIKYFHMNTCNVVLMTVSASSLYIFSVGWIASKNTYLLAFPHSIEVLKLQK